MAININLKKIPPYMRVIISLIPIIICIAAFIIFVYQPKNKEILSLQAAVAALDKEISSGEVKIRKLDQLIAENALLKAKLEALKEKLPAEQEVSELLKQISDLGLQSGLEILLWKPGERRVAESGLYAEIPVQVEVVTGYHNLGDFYSHISRLARIVNISGLKIGAIGIGKGKSDSKGNTATFTASTFVASTSEEENKTSEEETDQSGKKPKKSGKKPKSPDKET